MRYGLSPTRDTPTARATVHCGAKPWRACVEKIKSRVPNHKSRRAHKSAFEMAIVEASYTHLCAALACTAGSVAYMYMLVDCLYIACTAGSVAYM